jgi:uncharacterized membrane protein YphA (DoxX/SURF4 family)
VARPSARPLDVLGTLGRLALAAVWITSGAIKLFDPHGTVASVKAYQLIPDNLVSLVAAVLPFLELALGLLLLFGVGVRIVAVLSGLLLLVYIAGIAQSWARGLTIDCGCFGGGGQVAARADTTPGDPARHRIPAARGVADRAALDLPLGRRPAHRPDTEPRDCGESIMSNTPTSKNKTKKTVSGARAVAAARADPNSRRKTSSASSLSSSSQPRSSAGSSIRSSKPPPPRQRHPG